LAQLPFQRQRHPDLAQFAITSGGALRFGNAPNFDLPTDSDGDNSYQVQIQVSDGRASVTADIVINVLNSREGISVRRIASGLTQPLYLTAIPNSDDVFVLEKGGAVIRLDPATGNQTLVRQIADISTDGERGLLGLAVSPDFATTGLLFAFVTGTNGDLEIRRYTSSTINALNEPIPVVSIPHRDFSNHNGGWIDFGPDGNLYVATGDGGGSGDPLNNAQNTNSRLGKILRYSINPNPPAGPSPAFIIPALGNPFISAGGDPAVFAYGLRNPFRASFFADGLLIGDVGQNSIEEISLLRLQDGGANFGWPVREGTQNFRGTATGPLTDPVTEYRQGSGPREGRSVTGGYVYGGAIASLQDQYVFADFITGNVWTVPAASLVLGQTLESSQYERRNEDFAPDAGSLSQIASFGEDRNGNLYIVSLGGDIFLVEPE
ncbi:MAG: PQQ-dependent sugar dehydrogenase, partial [Pseudomonadota bacterium]